MNPYSQAFNVRSNIKALFECPGNNIPQLDGIRALAMLMVFGYHLQYMTSHLGLTNPRIIYELQFYTFLSTGYLGVDIFFVLSGFLIADYLMKEIHQQKKIPLGNFYLRRFLRLAPLYYIVLTVLFFLNLFPGRENIWANFLYVNNFLPDNEMFYPPSWSLAIEEQFYLILPLFIIFFHQSRKALPVLFLLFAGSFIIRSLLYPWNGEYEYATIMYNNPVTRFGGFIPGITIAWLRNYRESILITIFTRHRTTCSVLSLLSVTAIIYFHSVPFSLLSHQYAWRAIMIHNLYSLPVAWLLVFSLYTNNISGLGISPFLSLRLWRPLAQTSYCLYLISAGVIYICFWEVKTNSAFFDRILPGIILQTVVVGGIALLISFLIACLTFLFIEKPILNLRDSNRMTNKRV